MKCLCAQCLKSFEGRNFAQEFCTPKCHQDFLAESRKEARQKREGLRVRVQQMAGSAPCLGGRRSINFGLSDRSSR